MFVITTVKKIQEKRDFKCTDIKNNFPVKKIKINFYSLTNLTIMMGAKALWKNRREPVKYKAPCILSLSKKRFPGGFF